MAGSVVSQLVLAVPELGTCSSTAKLGMTCAACPASMLRNVL